MIKAEEAISIIKNNYPSERYSMLREAIDLALKLLELQKTPTFDEVVKAWGIAGYKILLNDNNSFYVSKNLNDEIEVSMSKTILNNRNISKEKLTAINLTIRYLEGKRENNEKI